MEELTTEQKAQRYDEAIERAKGVIEQNPLMEYLKKGIEYIFPELIESKDERIRKRLITWLKSTDGQTFPIDEYNACISWLEKQGEKPQGKSALEAAKEEKVDNANKIEPKDYSSIDPHFGKPIDKVEPKFHEGEWVILTAGELSTTLQIVKVDTNKRLYWFNDSSYLPIVDEECLQLWTIQDAKDGDVLTCLNDAGDRDVIFIFKNINSDEGWVFCFCAIDANGCFCTNNDYVGNDNSTNIHPATKEQCNQLEKAMTDAGYTFDFEKKELKKIEQKPAEWSEESERIYKSITYSFAHNYPLTIQQQEFVKSIKERYTWKPSEEQMDRLKGTINSLPHQEVLYSLYQDLKKLKEE